MATTHVLPPALIRGFSSALIAVMIVALSACAGRPDPADTEAYAEYQEINDPIEPLNRGIFEINRGLDTLFLEPASILFKDLLLPPLQRAVHNVLNNLRTPIVLANDLLQGDLDRAETTLMRFLINSTIGVAGLDDRAADMGYPYHGEDFGQTLAVWGVDEGPYVMLPVFGPSNPRDTAGLVVDVLLNPIWWWGRATDREYVTLAIGAAEAVNFRARNYDEIEDLERTSLDFYAAVRSLYRQRRADEILNGVTPETPVPPAFGRGSGQNASAMPDIPQTTQ